MDNHVSVDELVSHVATVPSQSAVVTRRMQWWALFAVAVVSFVTGIAGFVDALRQADTQLIAVVLLGVVGIIVVVRMVLARRVVPVSAWQPTSQLNVDSTWYQQVMHQAQLTVWQIWLGKSVRLLDYLAWVLLAIILVLSASTIFIFSAFGLYEGIRTGIDILDVVLVMGLVGPFTSIRSGIAKWRSRRKGARQRVNTLSETVRNAVGALNNLWSSVSESTAGVIRNGLTSVGSSVATTATTVAVGVTVTGLGLAAVSVAPMAVIATGRVVPIPPVVASIAGAEGRAVGLRGAIIYGCMDDIVAGNEDHSDSACQAAVHQIGGVCATWDGQHMPPACEQQIFQLLPEIQAIINNNDRNTPHNSPPSDPNQSRNLPNRTPIPLNNVQQPVATVAAQETKVIATNTPTVASTPPFSNPTSTSQAVMTPQATGIAPTSDGATPVANDVVVPPNMTQNPRGPNNDANGNPLDTPIAGNEPQPTPVP